MEIWLIRVIFYIFLYNKRVEMHNKGLVVLYTTVKHHASN